MFFSSFFLIQLRACCWGSIHKGKRLDLVVRMPFCTESSSGGRPSDPHLREYTQFFHLHQQIHNLYPFFYTSLGDSPADLHLISEQAFYSERLAQRNASLQDVCLPHLIHHFIAKVPAECSLVAEEGSADQTVS